MLEAKESLIGQQTLFDQEDDEEGETDDVEMVEADEVSNASDDSGSDSDKGSHDEEEDAETHDDAEELTRLNIALSQIVGTRPFDENGGATGADESSSEESMDDDEMFALDDKMVDVFKERKKATSKKQEKKEAKETIINFKNRVLDLLSIYVKREYRNRLVLSTLPPLLVLIRTTTSKSTSERACSIVRDLAQRCKGKELPLPTKARHAWDMMDILHEEATREASKAHATACSQSSLLLVKVLANMSSDHIERIVMRYATTQVEWMKGKRGLQPVLFADFLNWSTSYSKQRQ